MIFKLSFTFQYEKNKTKTTTISVALRAVRGGPGSGFHFDLENSPTFVGGVFSLYDQDARRFSLFPDFPPYYVWDTSFRDLGTTQAKARAVLGRSTVYTQTMHMLFIRLNIYISDSMEIILLNERFWQILPCQLHSWATTHTLSNACQYTYLDYTKTAHQYINIHIYIYIYS